MGPATAGPTEPVGQPSAGAPVVATATVTLITGDVVNVTRLPDGRSVADIERAPGAEGGVHTLTIDGDLYVYPDSALPFVAADQLDQALFNVSQLVAQGYDDASMERLPLIVRYDAETVADRALAGTDLIRSLSSIDGAALAVDRSRATELWDALTAGSPDGAAADLDGVDKVWLDGKVEASLDVSVPLVGAPAAWEAGYDGAGIDVAVLDTGVDATHPDLVDQIVMTESFVPGEAADVDPRGHGTHVASTIAGTGAASAGANRGVAPGADLMIGKVLDDGGFGYNSWIIAGMEWAAAEGAEVINMSLGSYEASDGSDPMAVAVNEITAETGALFVIAAGNVGVPGSIGSPGAADSALTVGATDDADQLAYFSSQGPRLGDFAIKPDLTAPGVGIVAARSAQSVGEGSYVSNDGTSMSTPHVAGAAAILAQRNPDWTWQQLKDALMSSTVRLPGMTPYQVGTGRLDVAAAVLDPVHATGSAWFGFFDWPHEGDSPVERTVTYRNTGDTAVTMTLTPELAAPDGMLTVSATEITVPAQSSTDVTLTADPNLAEIDHQYVGYLVATDEAGDVRARTSLGLAKERERYELTLTGLDRAGAPQGGTAVLFSLDSGVVEQIAMDPETGVARLRRDPGTYQVMLAMDVAGELGPGSTGVALVGDTEIVLDRDTETVLDARQATEVRAEVWRPTEPRVRRMEYLRTGDGTGVAGGYLAGETVDTIYAAPTEPVTQGTFEFYTRWRLAAPLLTVHHEGAALLELVQPGVDWLDGELDLPAVDAGLGTPEEFAAIDAEGKVVTVTRSDAVASSDLSQAATDAGATLLLVVNDQPGPLKDWFGLPDGTQSPVMVATIRQHEGEPLIADVRAGEVVLDVDATADSPYLFDLVELHADVIPADLVYQATKAELALMKTRYNSHMPVGGEEFRWEFRPHTWAGVGSRQRVSVPDRRREWVSAVEGFSWHKNVVQSTTGDIDLESRDDLVTFEPGQRTKDEWFAPVLRPRLGGAWWRPSRYDNYVSVNIPSWTDSGHDRGGAAAWAIDDITTQFWQGEDLLEESHDQTVYSPELSPDPTEYRIVVDAARDPERWRTSLESHTEWTFWSEHVADETPLALLQMDYDIATNLAGDARSGLRPIAVRASHMPELVDAPDVAGTTLEVSYDDGSTWSPVTLTQGDDGWLTGDLQLDADEHEFVSLRAMAWDDAGNQIVQEVTRAFGVRAAQPAQVEDVQ